MAGDGDGSAHASLYCVIQSQAQSSSGLLLYLEKIQKIQHITGKTNRGNKVPTTGSGRTRGGVAGRCGGDRWAWC